MRKIDIIGVGILKPQHFIPHMRYLVGAIRANGLNGRRGVNARPVFENGFHKRYGGKGGQSFAFPNVIGIKNNVRLCIVDNFVVQRQHIGNGFAGFPVQKTPQVLKAGIGDLRNILADFDAADLCRCV